MSKFDLKKFNKDYGVNLKMDNEVYNLRREVINVLYEIKKLHPEIPRINVRITENHSGKLKNVLGTAMADGTKVLWIPKNTISMPPLKKRQVILHEFIHTVCKKHGHNEDCFLMKSIANDIRSKDEQNERLLEYLRGKRT